MTSRRRASRTARRTEFTSGPGIERSSRWPLRVQVQVQVQTWARQANRVGVRQQSHARCKGDFQAERGPGALEGNVAARRAILDPHAGRETLAQRREMMPRPKKKQTRPAASASAPPSARMLDLIIGYWVSQLVHVAAKLQLADLLKDGPKSCAELAARTGTEPHRLYRLLRALASVGVFAERKAGRFALTPLATTLRSDRPDSMRDFALMMVERYNWDPWSRLLDGMSGEEVPFHAVHGMNAFEYLAKHPDDGVIFGRSMTSLSRTENPAVEAAYDFSRLGTLVDVGGSHGHLLAAILQKNRRLRGILFDQPHVLEQAKRAPYVSGSAVKERIKMMPGDFFISVPEGADAYIMKYILCLLYTSDAADERSS